MPNENKPATICVICTSHSLSEKASEFAKIHHYAFHTQENDSYELQLIFEDDKIELHDTTLNTNIFVDFVEGALAHREKYGGGKGQAIAKAIGLNKIKNPTVIDATAGLARDAYVLATMGCRVTLLEASPILYTLISNGIERARLSDNDEHSVDNFIDLINSDSKHYLKQLDADSKPDVIYIDPMYPERKKSALVKKDMQILHKLIGKSEDESDLLDTALLMAKRRVVVKRPSHAEPVTGIKPTMSISSKKTRYDVYVVT